MIEGGYILIARKLFDSGIMDKPPHYLKLWVWMLGKAFWKNGDKLQRGQFFTTIKEMQKAGGYKVGYRLRLLSVGEVRSAYEHFTKNTMINTMNSTRGMVITICNYNVYQNPANYEERNEHATNTQRTTELPHTIDEEGYKKEKKEKEINLKTSSPESLRLSGLLASLILENNPDNIQLRVGKRDATVNRWAKDIDRLIKLDGRVEGEVEETIRWCQKDSFWASNILSGKTLREKWDKLRAKMKTNPGNLSGIQASRGAANVLSMIERIRKEKSNV